MTRNKDLVYMEMAIAASKLSTCPRAHHGALITLDDRVVGIGFNGAARGLPHCSDAGCHISVGSKRCERSIHAETNAIINAHQSVIGGTLYVTGQPCERDAVLIVQSGLVRVVRLPGTYLKEPLASEVARWYEIAGIEVEVLDNDK